MTAGEGATYWDASAVLCALFEEARSEQAASRARSAGFHVISTLAWSEVHAAIARLERERAVASILAKAALQALAEGPWRRLNLAPEWSAVTRLAARWPLRGADLWHLALAKTLQRELPELVLFTFDARLNAAAQGEGLL